MYFNSIMRSLRSYLPPSNAKQEKTVIINARISREMREEVKVLAAKSRWKPSQIVRASLQKFIDDERAKSA